MPSRPRACTLLPLRTVKQAPQQLPLTRRAVYRQGFVGQCKITGLGPPHVLTDFPCRGLYPPPRRISASHERHHRREAAPLSPPPHLGGRTGRQGGPEGRARRGKRPGAPKPIIPPGAGREGGCGGAALWRGSRREAGVKSSISMRAGLMQIAAITSRQ
ncbi:hypothetical protein KIL84_020012 [Mauremys mutica]|uniref:Uncharacterized protein n=1 Tax=Mauremys mutica TaxID=74926 RepID=A0A9D3XW09_9SAUR|nr:hypothetical protein KIL84_020012 [Mauremys mutica]